MKKKDLFAILVTEWIQISAFTCTPCASPGTVKGLLRSIVSKVVNGAFGLDGYFHAADPSRIHRETNLW